MSTPFVSVIIPVFNGEKYLKEAIESVLAQDYPRKEIIVVNDGSTDNTTNIMKSFFPNLRYVEQSNQGLGASRNMGVKNALGTHLAFLDHDDLWAPTKLTEQVKAWKQADNDPLIFGSVQQFICSQLTQEEKARLAVNETVLPGYIASTLLLSKKRFLEVGEFMTQNKVGEFLDWYMRALAKNIPMQLLSSLCLKRRVHDNNMGRQRDLYKRTDYLHVLKANLNRRREEAVR